MGSVSVAPSEYLSLYSFVISVLYIRSCNVEFMSYNVCLKSMRCTTLYHL